MPTSNAVLSDKGRAMNFPLFSFPFSPLKFAKIKSAESDPGCSSLMNFERNRDFLHFYAPNFEEVEGAYWFGSVRAVCL